MPDNHTTKASRWVKPGLGRAGLCLLGILLAICLTALTSCAKREASRPPQESKELARIYEREAVTAVFKLDNQKPNIAERIRLTLEVTAPEEYDATMPSVGEKLGQFRVVDCRSTPPVLVGGSQIRQIRTYILEPFLPGEYSMPPMKVAFRPRGGQESDKQELETDEIKIQVKSVLPDNGDSARIHEISPPVDVPAARSQWFWFAMAGGLAVVGLISGGIYWYHRRPPGIALETVISAHELALQALEQLSAGDFLEKGEIKQFYQQVSEILRYYLENRFGLHAPEQTTDEFLFILTTNDALEPRHKRLLRNVLKHCDLVKFAEHQPCREDIQNTFDGCRSFVAETRVGLQSVSSRGRAAPARENPMETQNA
jgi:hypothetical protein